MTWFKVDDALHSHRKAVRAGVPAMGLWVLAGSWCADHLSDGFIPDYMAERMDRDFEEHAARLVDAGLWTAVEKGGDKGWQFHEWTEQQPTAEYVREKRADAKDRMHRLREQRRNSGSRDVRANETRSDSEVRVPRPDPTRPDPNNPPSEGLFDVPGAERIAEIETAKPKKRGPKPATRIPEDFAVGANLVTWAAEKVPLVDWPAETERFIDYWTAATKNDLKRDWDAAWRTWMRNAQERLETRGVVRRWVPGTEDQGRAGSELARRSEVPPRPRSPADQRIADAMPLYEKYKRQEEENARG